MSILSQTLLVSIVALIAGHSVVLLNRKQWFFLDPLNLFWAGVVVCYLLQPLEHGWQLARLHGPGLMDSTLAWILLGLAFVIIGYENRLGVRLGRALPDCPRHLRPARLSIAASSLIILGVLGYALMFASAGGFAEWLSVGRGGTDWANLTAYVGVLEKMLPVGIMLLLFHVEMHRASSRKRVVVWALGFLMLLWFFYLGTRSRTILFTVTLMAAYYLPRRRNPPKVLLASLFVVLLIASSFLGHYRDRFTDLSLHLEEIDWSEAAEVAVPFTPNRSTGRVLSGLEFNCVMTVVELVPDRVPYNLGYGHLEIFTRPIPRAIWPNKIYPAMRSVFPIFYYGKLTNKWVPTSSEPLLMGPALTFAGHWYAVGGGVALMIFGFLTGVLLKSIRTFYDRSPGNEGDLLLFSALIPIGFSEAAATPLNWVFTLPFVLIPLVLILAWAGARPRANRRALDPRHSN